MDFERVKQEKFSYNNSRVLCAINTLCTRHVRIKDLEYGLEPDMNKSEILDSVNYLNEGGYIKLRKTGSRREMEDLADGKPKRLEAKLTAKRIAFLNSRIDAPCIRSLTIRNRKHSKIDRCTELICAVAYKQENDTRMKNLKNVAFENFKEEIFDAMTNEASDLYQQLVRFIPERTEGS